MNPNDARERTTPFPGPDARNKPQPYKFTPDEIRVLRECNKESFYQRCIPFSILLGGGTYFGVKTGRFAPHPRFGAYPKVTVAALIGYFLGKFSYHQKCTEKFMSLPNSQIGRMLKARKEGTLQENLESGYTPAISLSPFSGMSETYTDISPPNRDFDYDTRPPPEGLDDSFRPSVDNPIVICEEEMPPEQKHETTYEELRKKNREEYEQRRILNARDPSRTASPQPSQRPPLRNEDVNEESKKASGLKNKYGDVWG